MNIKNSKYSRLYLYLAALVVWGLGACDDTMEGTSTLGFPTDTLHFVVVPNDTIQVPINVGDDWTLISNRAWCRAEDGLMETEGAGGKHMVPFIISDKGQGFEEDQAEITLRMNNESRVRAYVTRMGKDYAMQVTGDSSVYVAGQSIRLGTTGKINLNVKANFSTILSSSPQWLKVTRDKETMSLEVVRDSVRYTINNPQDSLILFNSDTTFRQSFHVHYTGMDSCGLIVSPKIEGALIVSKNAKRCHDENKVAYKSPITFAVEALNDHYKLVSVAYDATQGLAILPSKERWFEVEDDRHGNINLSFAEENKHDARVAYLLALPQAVYNRYETNLENFLWGGEANVSELGEEASQYTIVKMSQDGLMNITIDPEARWNLRVAADGKTYEDAIRGEVLVAADEPVKATIETYRGYRLMCASYNPKVGCTIQEVEDSWLDVTDTQQGNVGRNVGEVAVRFKANEGDERTLYLFALPLPLVEDWEAESSDFYAKISDELFDKVYAETDSVYEINDYAEQFVIAKFIQDANEANSIKVLKRGTTVIDVVKVKDADPESEWLGIAAAKGVPADKVFRCSMSLDYKYQIKPFIPFSIWNTGEAENKDRIEVCNKNGDKYVSGKDYVEEHLMLESTEGDYILVQLIATETEVEPGVYEYNIKEDFIIYFVDNDINYLKALVVVLE